jgi:catechol-2,3-dioxygenase
VIKGLHHNAYRCGGEAIYFRDPNGYVIELTAKRDHHERAMDPVANQARRTLQDWQKAKGLKTKGAGTPFIFDHQPISATAGPGRA